MGAWIITVYIKKRRRKKLIKYHHFRGFLQKRIPGYAIKNSNGTQWRIIHLSTNNIIWIVKPLLWHEGVLEYIHQAQTQNMKPLWQFVFRNVTVKVLVSLKCIILIIAIFIQFHSNLRFKPVHSGLSYYNFITFRYA